MTRVPLIEEQDHPELAELIQKVRGGRQGRLLNVYRALLQAPDLAGAWLDYMGAVRWNTQLDGRLREIVIVRIAHLNSARYAMRQHVPNFAMAEGVTVAECNALSDWRGSKLFSEHERAVLAYVDAMTSAVQVPNAVFEAIRGQFTPRQLVELTLLIGAYNMQNRVCEALDVELEPIAPGGNQGPSTP